MPRFHRTFLSAFLFSLFTLSAVQAASLPSENSTQLNPLEFDLHISPCSDLHAFVNGKWIANTAIPADQTGWGNFYTLQHQSLLAQHNIITALSSTRLANGSIEQQLRDFYDSGMDQQAIDKLGYAPIKSLLRRIDTLTDTQSITQFIADSFAQAQPYLFYFYIGADYTNASTQIAYMHEGGLGLPAPEYYQAAHYHSTRQAYLRYIATLLTLIGTPGKQAKQQAAQILALETQLAKASLSPTEFNDPHNRYHFVDIAQANKITPHVDWVHFFKTQGITSPRGFSLSQPRFFAELDRLLATNPTAQWQAYLRFHTVHQAASFLSLPFENAQFNFYKKFLRGQEKMSPRWERVLNTLNNQMGMALGQLYVQKYFAPKAKQKILALVENLRLALKRRFEKNDWMHPQTKHKALEKLATFLPKVGYPDNWRNWQGLVITPYHYAENIKASHLFNYRYMLSKIGQKTDRNEWYMTPQTVNAYYNPSDNTINFPAAILQPPFFDPEADDALNYGGIGAIIGHEMTHGYDDAGSQFDAQGNHVNWWTPADHKTFERRTALLIDQFNAYSPFPGLYVDGKLTLGENIADLEGIKIAYDALQLALENAPQTKALKIDGYTQNQRFFLNWALNWREKVRPEKQKVFLKTDPHSPPRFRANGPPSNMPEFARAFSCAESAPMLRPASQRVNIW
jgi:putative endopeptidase